jgi:hypothetical protein
LGYTVITIGFLELDRFYEKIIGKGRWEREKESW